MVNAPAKGALERWSVGMDVKELAGVQSIDSSELWREPSECTIFVTIVHTIFVTI